MAEIFIFHVQEDRSIKYKLIEPIMQEDKDVATWRFRIPKVLNQIDMSGWSWWFVYVNAKGQEFSELLTLTDDIDDPSSYSTADYDIDYGISKFPGSFSFALEAISAQQGGEISGEWHTKTYKHKVDGTLQGNQAEYAETESDVISALMQEVRNKANQLVGGATPLPVASVSAMTDTTKVYLNTTDKNWYYYNGTAWVSGGQYASGIVIDPTLSQIGQAADAKVTGDEIAKKVNAYTIVDYEFENKRINQSGAYVTSNGCYCTDYYPCAPGINVMWKGKSFIYNGAPAMCLIAFYDSSKTFLSGITSINGETASVQGDKQATAPADTAYVRFSTNVTNDYDAIVIDFTQETIATKAELNSIMAYRDENLLNEADLLVIDGCAYSDGWYSFNSVKADNAFSSDSFPHREFKENTQYNLSFDAKYDGSTATSMTFVVKYTDDTSTRITITGSIENHYSVNTTAGKTVSAINIIWNNSVKVYVKNLMMAEGNTEPDFIPYNAKTAVDQIARESIDTLRAAIDPVGKSVSFSVDANTSHNSLLDMMPLHLDAGEDYYVYIETDSNSGRTFQLYERTASSGTKRASLAVNKFHKITATNAADYISLFIGSGTTAVNVTLYSVRAKTYDSLLMGLISENKNALALLDTDVRTSKFHVDANVTHSSTLHKIALDVSAGDYVNVMCYGAEGRTIAVYARNDTEEQGWTIGELDNYSINKQKLSINAQTFGLYVSAGASATDVTFIVFKEDSVFARIANKYDAEYSVKLANAKRKANSGRYTSLTSPEIFSIAHFSDIHGNVMAMKKVSGFKDVFASYIDDILCTGDIVADKIADGTVFWDNNSDGSVLICIGNHDSLGTDGWSNPVLQSTLYNTFINPYKDNWDAETVVNHSYWYKDYAAKKIRLIAVDGTIFDTTEQNTQLTWLESALSGAKTNGYSVVGAVHFPPMPATFQKINSNFTALLHGTATDMSQFAWSTYNTAILSCVKEFIDGGGDFVCWLSGHTHWDLVSYDSRFPNQLFITVSCAIASSLFEERVRTSANGSGFIINTVCVDVARKYIKLLRYGAEWDDCLRHTGTCVINYGTSPATVLYES